MCHTNRSEHFQHGILYPFRMYFACASDRIWSTVSGREAPFQHRLLDSPLVVNPIDTMIGITILSHKDEWWYSPATFAFCFDISLMILLAKFRTCKSLRLEIGRHWTGSAYGLDFLLSGLIIKTKMCVAGFRWCLESVCTNATRFLCTEVSYVAIFSSDLLSSPSWTFLARTSIQGLFFLAASVQHTYPIGTLHQIVDTSWGWQKHSSIAGESPLEHLTQSVLLHMFWTYLQWLAVPCDGSKDLARLLDWLSDLTFQYWMLVDMCGCLLLKILWQFPHQKTFQRSIILTTPTVPHQISELKPRFSDAHIQKLGSRICCF